MARYIDAEKFLEDEIKRCRCVPLVGSCTTDNESLAYQLAKAPTADVVEVVKCKDCKHYEIGKSYTPYCNNVMNLFEEMKPTDFCSYGERRTDNDL